MMQWLSASNLFHHSTAFVLSIVLVSERDAAPNFFALDREYRIALPVTVAPKSQTWFVIEEDSLILAPDRTAPSQRER